MTAPKWTWIIHERYASHLGAHREMMDRILDELRLQNWTSRDIHAVNLALEESLTNAVRHGNVLDASKFVDVECKIRPKELWITIEDEGNGFNPDDIPDPTAPENLDRPGGRGLMLIKAYMSTVAYNERGNRVTMTKRVA